MTIVNQVMDRAMRGLVATRMRSQIAYTATDSAVILVAPQRDLLVGEASNQARLVRTARAAGISVIYAPMTQPYDGWTNPTPSQQAIGDAGLLRPGSPGADIHPALSAAEGDIVMPPFEGLSAFAHTALALTLASRQCDHVIIAGARTDIEVDSTARDATEAGLHTTVVSDCCTGSSREGHDGTVKTTLPRLVHAVLTLSELTPLVR
ncbi:isochorismatase family cysteine hydrolase [Mycobacterium sp. 360MFTsu5.1]|uniref:cysteine hydrolase family protein n=1 Tax=Mycobacterium sp. 360MFTsu5.1 TaxID=1172186 RepID=UPI00037A5D6E|nr:isochorismatase family cysteine hydrolase [Mycobacterium sp. 360MFTsu5.1]